MPKLKIPLMMILALLLTTAFFSAAQADEIEGVEIDGMKHLIHYDAATDPLRITVRDAIEQSVLVYDALFAGTTPPIIVDLLPAPADDADGNPLDGGVARHTKVELLPFIAPDDTAPEFCLINLYSVPTSPDFEFMLAQEIAQCYLFYHVPAVSGLEFEFTPFAHGWWGEGASLWLAAQVYDPTSGIDWSKPQAALLEGMEDTLVKNGAGTFWFWQTLADDTSKEDVIAILKAMPDDINAHVNYVKDNLLPDADTFMHKYVLAIAASGLPVLPLVEDLYTVVALESLPGEVKIQAEPMGIGMVRVNVGSFAEGEGFTMELTDAADSGLTVSLSDSTLVNEGEPIKFCDSDGKVSLVYSRASAGLEGDPPVPAYLNFERIEECDDTPADSETADGAVPACIVGGWVIAELPEMPGVPASEISGVARVSIDRDGNVVTTYRDFAQTMQIEGLGDSTFVVNGVIRNKIAIAADGTIVDAGEYALEGISANMEMGGMSMDATDIFLGFAETSFGLPASAVITCVDENTLHVDVAAGSTTARMVYTRG